MAKKITKSAKPARQKKPAATARRMPSRAKRSDTPSSTPTADDVAVRAYYLYLERGHGGRELDDWLRAERELTG